MNAHYSTHHFSNGTLFQHHAGGLGINDHFLENVLDASSELGVTLRKVEGLTQGIVVNMLHG